MNGPAESPPGPQGVRTEIRVRYAETDRMGVVYYANYLVWFEAGRNDLFRHSIHGYAVLEDDLGLAFPVIAVEARYHAPARFDEVVTVHTRLTAVGGARVRFDYRITADGEQRLLTSGHTEHAAVDLGGRPRRIPRELRDRLEQCMS